MEVLTIFKLVVTFFGLIGFAIWQLVSVERDIRAREASEREAASAE